MPRLRSRANLTAPSAPTASSTRPRRNTANQAPPAAVIQRSSPEESRQSIHLTVKASPGKLRKATGTNSSVVNTAVSSRNIVAGKRASRNSRIVQEPDSDEDEDEEDDAEEVDAMDIDDEEDDEDAEGDEDEDMDAEGDEDDEVIAPPPPRIVVSTNKSVPIKPSAAQDSVEAKEMAMDDDDDEELSELDSEMEGEDEDAEGEDEDAEGEEDDELAGPDEEMDSDMDASRDQTPDLSKMTRRQQAMVVQGADESLMALSNGKDCTILNYMQTVY
jgi:Ino eighty subunit 2